MKNLFAALLVAFAVSTASNGFATATTAVNNGQQQLSAPDSVAFAIEDSKVDVIFQAARSPKMIIRLKDEDGHTLAVKSVSQAESGTRIRFDLSQLADGLYSVRVWDGKGSQERDIEVKTVSPAISTREVILL